MDSLRKQDSLFGPASFYKAALSIAVPVMVQSLLTGLVSLVDNFMVAALGDAKMAGVNVANQINFIYMVIINTICMAGGIYLSQHRGAGDKEGMKQAFRFKLILAIAVSLVHLVICMLFAEPLLGLMLGGNAGGGEIVAEGARYLRAVSPSFLFIGINVAISTAFRDTGVTTISLVVSVLAALTNTFFNWILIYGNLGAPRLEVTGAAIATNMARFVEMGLFLAMLLRRKPDFSIRIRNLFRIDRGLFRAILSKSGMMLFSETAWVMSETIITALYNGRGGAETVAGMAAGWTIANIMFLAFPGIQAMTAVVVGSTLGAGRLEEGKRKARWVMSGSVFLGIGVGLVAAATTFIIPIVFANLSPAARGVTKGIVFVIAAYLPLWCLLNSQFAVSRAGGDTLMGVWADVGVSYAFFIPAAIIIAKTTNWGPVALFGIAKLSDIPKIFVAAWWLRKERWVKNLAVKSKV
ncbi:MAG: MATE family efflux transporter [Spirochaetes bacterium]|nr:MATE family efflux transporter [Spirochaetota bacterium]